MKSLFNGLVCASLLVFAVGCGKDNKSGSKGGVPLWNLYSSPVSTNLQQWYQAAEQIPTMGVRNEVRKVDIMAANNGCSQKTYLGFINITSCFSGNAVESTSNITNQIVPIPVGQPRSSVGRLAAVFNPAAGTAVSNITNIGGSVYQIDVYNQTSGHSIRYKIDTALNAAFNPVEIYDTSTRRMEYVINPQDLR